MTICWISPYGLWRMCGDRRWQDRDSITGGYRQCTEAGGCVKVGVDGDTLRISEPGMMLDLGAVGKGYGCDMAAEYLKGTDAAGACVALGGSIVVYGSKPDGTAWKVGVKDPRAGEGTTMGVISFGDGETAFVSTSGDYESILSRMVGDTTTYLIPGLDIRHGMAL